MTGSRFGLTRRVTAFLALTPICFLGAMVTTAAEARENYALIAAASEYPNLEEKYWLKGPANDAVLVRDYLLTSAPVKFEPDNVVTLGSGEGLELATHDNIMRELAALAEKARPGDFIFLQFSGHGSYQPALNDMTEQDGRDEIFLAADTMSAAPGEKFMRNVITDDQFGEAFTAIRKTGATLWLVFDSCNSGTITRGAPGDDELVMREIKPTELGIDESAFPVISAETGMRTDRAIPIPADVFANSDDGTMGDMIAFFAAQSSETTPERPYEVTLEDGTVIKQNYGVFTYSIFEALAQNPGQTYRQLAQSVLANYASQNMLKPTPLFEGALDLQVFGDESIDAAAQWPTVVGSDSSLTISAGQLHGLARGTRLLVLPSPAAANEDAIGVLEVASNDQLRSRLAAAPDADGKVLELADVPVGAYVRLIEQAYPFELTVARPDPTTTPPVQLAAIESALDAILADDDRPLRLRVVEPGDAADVRLAVFTEREVFDLEDEADQLSRSLRPVRNTIDPTSLDAASPLLWLLPPTGTISLRPEKRSNAMDIAPTADEFAASLSENLVTIYRATGLSRLSQVSTFRDRDFSLSFGVQAAGSDEIVELRPESTPIVRPYDRLYVDFTNRSGKTVDLNVLYVDHDYGITLLCQAHLVNNDKLFQPIGDLNETDRSAERIVAVINESGKDITDLRFLEQRGIVIRTRGADDPSLLGMLADLSSGLPTRGPTAAAQRDTKQPRGAVVMVPLEVIEPNGETPASDIAPNDDRQPVGEC